MLANHRLADITRHFTYESWANQRMQAAIDAFTAESTAGAATADIQRIWGHLRQAKQRWLSRLLEAPTPSRASRESAAASAALHPTASRGAASEHPQRLDADASADDAHADADDDRWRQFLATLSDHELSRVVTFHNLRGEPQADALGDILSQVLVHSAYHRGQLALLLRQAGHQPPLTDFIAFARSELSPPGDSRKLAVSPASLRIDHS